MTTCSPPALHTLPERVHRTLTAAVSYSSPSSGSLSPEYANNHHHTTTTNETYLPNLTLDLQIDRLASTASFRLRVSVALRGIRTKTTLWLCVPTERLAALSIVDDHAHPPPTPAAASTLTDVMGLRLRLHEPPTLVAPDRVELAPKTRAMGELLKGVCGVATMAQPVEVVVWVERKGLEGCEGLLGWFGDHLGLVRSARPVWWEGEGLEGMYKGKGGRVVPRDEVVGLLGLVGGERMEGDAHVGEEEPPSYDELGPGPVVMGAEARGVKRRRVEGKDGVAEVVAALDELRQRVEALREEKGDKGGNERLRRVEEDLDALRSGVEMLEERMEERFMALGREFDKKLDGLSERLETSLRARLEMQFEDRFEPRLMEACEQLERDLKERLRVRLSKGLRQRFEDRLDEVADELEERWEEKLEEMREETEGRIEDGFSEAKSELREMIEEEMKGVEEAVKESLDGAMFSVKWEKERK